VRLATLPAVAGFLAIAGLGVASCSQATGIGSVTGTLDVPDCWSGPFDLQPTFFAASAYMNTLSLRIQRGGDYETFSDGVEILVDDTTQIIPAEYGKALTVSLPSGVTPPGVPLVANPNPSIVHLSLYLQATCQIQDVALYAMESVTLNAAGNCDARDGGGATIACGEASSGLAPEDAGANLDAGAASDGVAPVDASTGDGGTTMPIGHSTMTFTSLFDGNEGAISAAERLSEGTFKVYLADPREMCPGGLGPPPPCRGFLQGNFKFYFQKGRPAQAFPQ
jgi:hypothetical protein